MRGYKCLSLSLPMLCVCVSLLSFSLPLMFLYLLSDLPSFILFVGSSSSSFGLLLDVHSFRFQQFCSEEYFIVDLELKVDEQKQNFLVSQLCYAINLPLQYIIFFLIKFSCLKKVLILFPCLLICFQSTTLKINNIKMLLNLCT